MAYSLDFRAHSEVGLVRRNNQDSGYASPTMLMVADGMGGAAAGDLASTVAIREIMKSDGQRSIDDAPEVLAGALARANHTLADLVKADPALDGMGTTVCGALFTGNQLGMLHLGDSRGYLMRAGKLHQLTHDHSWVQSLVDEGKISLAEAAVHPHRSLLLKVLNGQNNHDPDLERVDLLLDDRLLFCSDGLCGFVPDAVIAEILADEPDLDEAMAKLVAAAHRGGGADNITILLADVGPHDEALAAKEPVVVGAALEGTIPDVEEHTLTGMPPVPPEALQPEPHATGERALEPDEASELVDEEVKRYAPKGGRSHGWLTAVAVTAALSVLLAGLGWGAWRYSRTQYFVGTQDDQVAIFRGLPGSLLGIELGELAEPSQVRVDDLPLFYRQQVQTTIPVSSLAAAHTTLAELQARSEACLKQRAGRGPVAPAAPSATPLATPGALTTPGSLATAPTPLTSPTAAGSPKASSAASPTASPSADAVGLEGC